MIPLHFISIVTGITDDLCIPPLLVLLYDEGNKHVEEVAVSNMETDLNH